MSKWVSDCSKMPSDSNCDLKISGSDKDVVADTSYQHAIGLHKHDVDAPGLRDQIKTALVEE